MTESEVHRKVGAKDVPWQVFEERSGTLVSLDGERFILTATHVWEKLARLAHVGIPLASDGPEFVIERDKLRPISIGRRKTDEWGPDLSLLRIPSVHVGRFDAHRVSYNLAKQLPSVLEEPIQLRAGLWAVVGAPAERTNLASEGGTVVQNVAFGAIDEVNNRDGFDYLDLGVDRSRRTGAPVSFGGVSGGGLWQVFINASESDELVWTGNKRLEGVAFYQSGHVEGRQLVRCHGRRSLYHHGLQALHAA